MSVDILQDKIRKLKNPTMLELPALRLPEGFPGEGEARYGDYCDALLEAVKGLIPAVRVSFAAFCLLGPEGIAQLQRTLRRARELGYYVALDAPEIWSPAMAELTARNFFGPDSRYPCDGVIIPSYLGSDIWKAFLPYVRDSGKDVFCVVRTGNKSGSEIQDRQTGSRMLHVAAAEIVSRSGGEVVGKFGFSRLAVMAGASSAESLHQLRSKYPKLFLLVDGLDYPNANARNCAAAFNQFGHGAVVCSGSAITCAWEESEGDPIALAAAAAERVKKNLTRYITIL